MELVRSVNDLRDIGSRVAMSHHHWFAMTFTVNCALVARCAAARSVKKLAIVRPNRPTRINAAHPTSAQQIQRGAFVVSSIFNGEQLSPVRDRAGQMPQRPTIHDHDNTVHECCEQPELKLEIGATRATESSWIPEHPERQLEQQTADDQPPAFHCEANSDGSTGSRLVWVCGGVLLSSSARDPTASLGA